MCTFSASWLALPCMRRRDTCFAQEKSSMRQRLLLLSLVCAFLPLLGNRRRIGMFPKRGMYTFSAYKEGPTKRMRRRRRLIELSLVCEALFLSGEGTQAAHTPSGEGKHSSLRKRVVPCKRISFPMRLRDKSCAYCSRLLLRLGKAKSSMRLQKPRNA